MTEERVVPSRVSRAQRPRVRNDAISTQLTWVFCLCLLGLTLVVSSPTMDLLTALEERFRFSEALLEEGNTADLLFVGMSGLFVWTLWMLKRALDSLHTWPTPGGELKRTRMNPRTVMFSTLVEEQTIPMHSRSKRLLRLDQLRTKLAESAKTTNDQLRTKLSRRKSRVLDPKSKLSTSKE